MKKRGCINCLNCGQLRGERPQFKQIPQGKKKFANDSFFLMISLISLINLIKSLKTTNREKANLYKLFYSIKKNR